MKHSHFKKLALSQLAIYLLAASSIATAQSKEDGSKIQMDHFYSKKPLQVKPSKKPRVLQFLA
jgi:hypothetical protein